MGMSHAYGPPAYKKMIELLAQTVDIGYTFFDTAEIYGTPDNPHDNEELVGAALKPFRDKVVIGTKFGVQFDWTSDATNLPVMTDSRPEVIKKIRRGFAKASADESHRYLPATSARQKYFRRGSRGRHEKLFPVLEELNIGYVAFSPTANGLLSGVYNKNSKFAAKVD